MATTPSEQPLSAKLERSPLDVSARLHARVRRFVELSVEPPLLESPEADTFERLALDIARFQLAECPGFARLVQRAKCTLTDVDALPAVPVDAFRMARVATHPPELDALTFRTSGTTAAESGRHPIRELTTYRALAVALARQSLFAVKRRGIVVALAPEPGERPASSLAFMMQTFMEHFDGRALTAEPTGVPFDARARERWLLSDGDVSLDHLRRACRVARARQEALFILATSFSLAATLEALDGERLDTPPFTTIMVTGGFKGRKTDLNEVALRRQVALAFNLRPGALIGEYGMTELTSQLYEAPSALADEARERQQPSRATRAAFWPTSGRIGLYHAPPWLRATAVEPSTGLRVANGELGVARFVDLGNVDSAVAIVTEDLVREVDGGLELLGRRNAAMPRGCSLPFEGLLTSADRMS